jgi:hypothetical protein
MQATNVTEKFFMYLVRSYRCVVSQRVKTATWLAQELFREQSHGAAMKTLNR